jgi:hypothetical protein
MRRDQAKRFRRLQLALSLSQYAAQFVRQRRSLERAGLHIEDAIAASRYQLAGGLRGKIDEMPRRLIAVIVVSSVSAAFGFVREGLAGLHA